MRPTVVKCPTCGRQTPWDAKSPFRPFCSERCQLVDLGAWLAEERGIAGDAVAEPGSDDETGR